MFIFRTWSKRGDRHHRVRIQLTGSFNRSWTGDRWCRDGSGLALITTRSYQFEVVDVVTSSTPPHVHMLVSSCRCACPPRSRSANYLLLLFASVFFRGLFFSRQPSAEAFLRAASEPRVSAGPCPPCIQISMPCRVSSLNNHLIHAPHLAGHSAGALINQHAAVLAIL